MSGIVVLGRALWFAIRWIAVIPIALGIVYGFYQTTQKLGPALGGLRAEALDVTASAICGFCTCAAAGFVAPALKRWSALAFGVAFALAAAFVVVASATALHQRGLARDWEGVIAVTALVLGALAGIAFSGRKRSAGAPSRLPAVVAWPLVVLAAPLAVFFAGMAMNFSEQTTQLDTVAMVAPDLVFLASLATAGFATALAPHRRLTVAVVFGAVLILPGMIDLIGGLARPVISHAVESAGRDYHPYARYAWVQALYGAGSILAGLIPVIAVVRLRAEARRSAQRA